MLFTLHTQLLALLSINRKNFWSLIGNVRTLRSGLLFERDIVRNWKRKIPYIVKIGSVHFVFPSQINTSFSVYRQYLSPCKHITCVNIRGLKIVRPIAVACGTSLNVGC